MSEQLKLEKDEKWILHNLQKYGNSVCDKQIRKYGEELLLKILSKEGYPCELSVITSKYKSENGQKIKDVTYIVNLKKRKKA